MQKLNKKIRTLFFICLGLSIGFPAGVLCIIFGAVNGITPLLVAGIILAVAGFYVMPILWVQYGIKRGDRTLLHLIENEHIYTVSGLSAQTGYKEDDVRARISRLIHSQCLVGYLFKNDALEFNANEKQTASNRRTRLCEGCGAYMIFDGLKFRCEYCGSTADDR